MCILILLLTVVPTVELYLLIQIGHNIGAPNTILLVITTGVVGSFLARQEGIRTLYEIQKETASGQLPGRKLVDGVLILIGGVLLITPGVITDIVGLLIIFPLTRILFRESLIRSLKHKISWQQGGGWQQSGGFFAYNHDKTTSAYSDGEENIFENAENDEILQDVYHEVNDDDKIITVYPENAADQDEKSS